MKLFVPHERRAEVRQALQAMQGRMELCKEYQGAWIQEVNSPRPYILYAEQWQTEAALYEHIRSPIYLYLLAAIELSTQAPDIRFYFVSETKGMELIEAVRGQQQEAARDLRYCI